MLHRFSVPPNAKLQLPSPGFFQEAFAPFVPSAEHEGRPQRPQALFYCRPQRQGQLLGGAFPSAHCLPPCLLQPARFGYTTPCLVLPVQFRWHSICAYRVTPHAMSGNCTNPSPQLPCSRSRLRPTSAHGKPPERAAPAHSSSNPAAGPPGTLHEAAGSGAQRPQDAARPAARPVRTLTERGGPAAALTLSAPASELPARTSPPSRRELPA